MKLLQKIFATAILCLFGAVVTSGTVGAFWPFSCNNSQKCKEKFDKSCDLIEANEGKCYQQFADLYSTLDKLSDDVHILRESQVVSENIFNQLMKVYEEWSHEGFRIDTDQHINYLLLRKKFSDQNRVVEQNEQLVKDDIKIVSGILNTKPAKDGCIDSLKHAIDAYYKYNMAVAKEDIDNSDQ